MDLVKLFLFGQPRLENAGKPVDLSLRKAVALLAYLAMTRHSKSRDALAALFWPEDDQTSARGNLRRALSRINVALGEGLLLTDREQAGINPTANLWLDVAQFRRCLAACNAHSHPPDELCASCLLLLTEAASYYTDEFMAGFTLRDCPDFDEWQFFERESLRQALTATLERLVRGHIARRDVETALYFARRRLALDPLHEPAHQQLMELYARSGQLAAAIRQYHECVRILQEELGVAPSEETVRLHKVIRSKADLVTDPRRQAGPPLDSTTAPLRPAAAVYALPNQTTSFIGREEELAALAARLADPACRLLTLLGPGGMGKTRLALKAAENHLRAFVDGAIFVPLASLDPISSEGAVNPLVTSLLDALQLVLHDGDKPENQLLTFLRGKELLLVLDSFEHLLQTVDTVTSILRHAPRVKMLVTSRERLHVQDEWLLPIQGMRYPLADPLSAATITTQDTGDGRSGRQGTEAAQYDAVRLFAERVRQIQPDFDLPAEYAAVARICQLVDGVPLALELAAAWVRTISCDTIAQEIEKGTDFLVTTLYDLPERHRSLRAVFEHSWRLLPAQERMVFQQLSIFEGGFSREAGEEVAGASLPLLASLVDKSLLQRAPTGRYAFHALLRQYAAEKLQSDPAGHAAIAEAHAHYYAALLHRRDRDLIGSRQLETLAEITAELDNVRASWQWAVETRELDIFEKAQNALASFYEARSQFQEAEAAFGRGVAVVRHLAMDGSEEVNVRNAAVLGALLGNQGWFAWRTGLPTGKGLLEESIALLRQGGPGARWDLAANLTLLANRLFFEDYTHAEVLLHEALVLATEAGDPWLLALATVTLGQATEYRGDYRVAVSYLQQSIAHFQQLDERRFRAFALNSLGRVAYAMGDYALAKDLLRQAYRIRQAFGDPIGTAFSLLAVGVLARLQGDLSEAREHIKASLKLFEEMGGRGLAPLCLLALGEVARLEERYAEADDLFQKSLAHCRSMGLDSQLPPCLNSLARLAYQRGDLGLAEQYLQESLAICHRIANLGEMASALCHLGYVTSTKGRGACHEAQAYFRQALKIVTRTGAAPVALDVLVGWAMLLIADEPSEVEHIQAIELATLVQHHAAGDYETHEKAKRLLAQWLQGLSSEAVALVQRRGRRGDLWQTVTELIEQVP